MYIVYSSYDNPCHFFVQVHEAFSSGKIFGAWNNFCDYFLTLFVNMCIVHFTRVINWWFLLAWCSVTGTCVRQFVHNECHNDTAALPAESVCNFILAGWRTNTQNMLPPWWSRLDWVARASQCHRRNTNTSSHTFIQAAHLPYLYEQIDRPVAVGTPRTPYSPFLR